MADFVEPIGFIELLAGLVSLPDARAVADFALVYAIAIAVKVLLFTQAGRALLVLVVAFAAYETLELLSLLTQLPLTLYLSGVVYVFLPSIVLLLIRDDCYPQVAIVCRQAVYPRLSGIRESDS